MASLRPAGLKIQRITARVRDIERATAWYRDVLGFTVGECGSMLAGAMKYAHLHWPDFGLSLVQLDRPALEIAAGQPVLPSWVHPVFAVPDPDSLYQRFKRQGVKVVVRGQDAPVRVETFLFYDSEGNELEIVSAAAT